MADELDVVVIGAGPGGEVCAGRLAEAGLQVAIVEEHLVGGECSFYACIPSKALLRPAQAVAEARRLGAEASVAPEAVLALRDRNAPAPDDSGQVPWLRDRGIELVRGRGRLTGEREVAVGDRVLRARRAVVLATGTDPVLPPVDGLAEARPWTNREATQAATVPASLVVLGGGPVGVELAQAWATLGAQVVLLHRGARLLPREEPFASELVAEGLRAAGVDVRLRAEVRRVRREGDEVVVEAGGEPLRAAELLVATGRRQRSADLGLEAIGLAADGPVEVDDELRAGGRDWLRVVGDLNGRSLLTHMAKAQGRRCADLLLGRDAPAPPDGPLSPRVTFCEPQVAAVGHTLASARDAGLDARAIDTPAQGSAGGLFVAPEAPGTCRLVVADGLVVGATFVGVEVAEWLHAATIAVVGRVPLATLRQAVPAFPSRSEVWLALSEA